MIIHLPFSPNDAGGLARWLPAVALAAWLPLGHAVAQGVPTDIQMPGTQPGEANLESPQKCDNCHSGYDPAVEPDFNWGGSMMAHATRDPLFWATVAIAEQDFPGAGDLCLRCHTAENWVLGNSSPTDGSALVEAQANGVSCDVCHQLTNPDGSEHVGVQNAPFLAHDEGNPPTGYYGSAMYVFWGGAEKLGPYSDPASPHNSLQSKFHRSSELCATCHDISNPATGDLAHNNGAQQPLAPGTFSGVPGSPVDGKAAFNNLPYQYGIIERTSSEHAASLLATTKVSDYTSLPPELQEGAIEVAYEAAIAAGPNGNYADGTTRYFTCQTCHMRPVQGKGCNKNNAPIRDDLPLHDLTGGSYWTGEAIKYLDAQGRLLIGGGLNATELAEIDAGSLRAQDNLANAAELEVQGNQVRIINLTGHKLISGFAEGRREWLNVRWYDAGQNLIREDGGYGTLDVMLNGQPLQVESLLDLNDPNTKIYEAHYGMTQEWAAQLIALGTPASLPLSFDRITGLVDFTLGDLAALPPGSDHETFHFALNNAVLADNRIPPYGMSYDAAEARNILPVPATQYGNPGSGGRYDHWDDITLTPPPGSVSADITLMYQSTSWEYVQFLVLANTKQNPFHATLGDDLLEAWLNTGMAAPVVMHSETWSEPCNGSVTSYCTAKTTSCGGTPAIGATGLPSASATSGFVVDAVGTKAGKAGLLIYTENGRATPANPFLGGWLCVATPIKRSVTTTDTIGTPGLCDGMLALDMNAFAAGLLGGNPLPSLGVPGTQIDCQFWGRDTPGNSLLTDALEYFVCP